MIDVANLAGTPTASDLGFRVGSAANPSTWTAGPAPASVLVRPGAGINGSARIEITWADRAIMDEWLQVTVAANANTGLTNPDVFSFGNLIGSANATVVNGQYTVTPNDLAAAQNDLHTFLNPAPISDPCDFNRDGKVDATDQVITRNSYSTSPVPQLQRILGAPGTPYLISASGARVVIGWPVANDPNVAIYDVYRVDGQGHQQEFTGVGGTSYTDTTVSDGTSYSYTIVSQDANGNTSIPSASLTVTPSAASIAAIADHNLTEGGTLSISTTFTDPNSANTHTATITWGDGTTTAGTVTQSNGSGTISGSHLYSSGGLFTALVTMTDQNGAVAATTFNVSAMSAAPSNLAATAVSYNTINLSWVNNSPSAADFEIEVFNSFTSTWSFLDQAAVWQTSYVASGLAPNQAYTFQVVADNAAGQSAASNSASATTQPLPTPTISSQASASSGTVTGTTVQLSVSATDPGGGSDLIYFWATTSIPNGAQPPAFSDEADHSANSVTATFSAAGSYTFQVTVTNAEGGTSNSAVTVIVQQTATSVRVTPDNATVLPGGTQQLSAKERDQFGNDMNNQPQFTWSVASGVGSVSAAGLYTGPASGSGTISATAGSILGQAQISVAASTGLFKVTITGRAYEPGYSSANTSGDLTVTNTGWIVAANAQAAVALAVSGTVTLNDPQYDRGNSTLSFPANLNDPNGYGFGLLGFSQGSGGQFTGQIGLWDGDSHAPSDWDFYWNVTVAAINVDDVTVAEDATPTHRLVDSASVSQAVNFSVAQQSDGTAKLDLSADISPNTSDARQQVLWSLTGGTVDGASSGNFASTIAPIILDPGTGSRQYVLAVGVDLNGDGTLQPNEATEIIDVADPKFLIEQESFGATNAASFHVVRQDPTPSDYSAHDLTGPQWQDLDHQPGDVPGEIDGPICYTRSSGVNGFVTMTVKADIWAAGANANGSYRVQATIKGTNLQGQPEGVFTFNPVAATVGTLNNTLTHQQDAIITANLTGSDFHIPSVIRDVDYTITYTVSVNGGPWQAAGQAKTKCYVINGNLPAYWTYNKAGNSTLPNALDTDHNPLWTVLDIASRAADGMQPGANGDLTSIIQAIWRQFIDISGGAQNLTNGVADAHGRHMHYWQNETLVKTAKDSGADTFLIANSDGSCGAWASLLVDCLRVEGINAYLYGIFPVGGQQGSRPIVGETIWGFQVSATKGQGGVPSINAFDNHAVVELTNDGTTGIYDPSYGNYYPSAQAWRNDVLYKWVWQTPSGQQDVQNLTDDGLHKSTATSFTLTPD